MKKILTLLLILSFNSQVFGAGSDSSSSDSSEAGLYDQAVKLVKRAGKLEKKDKAIYAPAFANKVTDKRNEKDAFTKLVSDFTIEVKRCGNVNHKDFITRLENNLEENLNYMDDFENIKEFRLSEEGLHDVFIPFILRIKKLGKWDNYLERLFRMFSLLNKVVARGNLWNSFSKRQIDIVKDKDFDTNPAEVLIKHLIEGIDMSNALVQATHKDVVSPDGTLKHQTIFDEFINELKSCNGVLFSGGNQSRIVNIISKTPFHDLLMNRFINEIMGSNASFNCFYHLWYMSMAIIKATAGICYSYHWFAEHFFAITHRSGVSSSKI